MPGDHKLDGPRFFRIHGHGAAWYNPGKPWENRSQQDRDTLAGQIVAAESSLRQYPDYPVELILGIDSSGASYLLFDEVQLNLFCKQYQRPRPDIYSGHVPSRYLSLSPVYYANQAQLAQKLKLLDPAVRKNKSGDYSVLNRRYQLASGGNIRDDKKYAIDKHTPTITPGKARADFEQNRLLYRIWRGQAYFNFDKFAIRAEPWRTRTLRVCSLYFTMWETPDVPLGSLTEYLECGWTKFFMSADGNDVYDSRCLPLQTSRKNKGDFSATHNAEPMKRNIIEEQLREFCKSISDAPAGHATVVLVYNENCARRVLKTCGVSTDHWQTGVDGLLERVADPPLYDRKYNDRSYHDRTHNVGRYNDRYKFQHRRNSRSRSPEASTSRGSRRDYPETKPLPAASVHVVDIARLQRALYFDSSCEPNVSYDVRLRLDAQSVNLEHELGYCAANESRLLLRMWKRMMEGNAIDDQLEDLQQKANQQLMQPPPPPPPEKRENKHEEDEDPNAVHRHGQTLAKNPFEFDSDDSETEYVY